MEKFIKKSNKPSKIFLEYLNTSKYNTSYFNIGDVFVFKNEFQFIEVQEHIQSSLTKIFPLSLVFILQEELVVKTSSKYVRPLLIIIKRHTPRSYQQLIDITAVDHPKQKQRFEIVYQLLSVKYNQRLMLSVSVSEGIMLDTVTSIYASAG
jgi:NADH:ubiquinone oxidoreductase subunit C